VLFRQSQVVTSDPETKTRDGDGLDEAMVWNYKKLLTPLSGFFL
jgi:hypothetical protein